MSTVPVTALFRARGGTNRDEVVLTLDELEALRLADLEGLYQEQAAWRMGVSRPTFGRIIEGARRKSADALVNGLSLRIAGGPVIAVVPRGDCATCDVARAGRGTCSRCACPQRPVLIGGVSREPAQRDEGS